MLKSIMKSGLVAGCVGITAWDLLAYVSPVDGMSMQPIINPSGSNDDYLLLWRIPIKLNRLERGDVVTLVSPKNPDQYVIKRVIGLPGDVIKTISYRKKYVRVPPGHCWIEGDNHDKSQDSNSYGVVPIGLLFAKAGYIIWPPERLGRINTEIPSDRLLHPLNVNHNDDDNNNNDETALETLISATNSKQRKATIQMSKENSKLNYFVDFVSP